MLRLMQVETGFLRADGRAAKAGGIGDYTPWRGVCAVGNWGVAFQFHRRQLQRERCKHRHGNHVGAAAHEPVVGDAVLVGV